MNDSKNGSPEQECSCSCSCGKPAETTEMKAHWIVGAVQAGAGRIPLVSTEMRRGDIISEWKVRWSIGRMSYTVPPGLFGVGAPGPESPVLVSANYKMSFDRLRTRIVGRNAWILVIDTKGINVWCAAGKGTFGTDEIVRRAEAVKLSEVVTHRTLVAPQLGAPGVSAHEVRKRSGFRVVYGPVRADDLGAFLDAGMKATREMRRVLFPIKDRTALIPIELVGGLKYLLPALAFFIALSGLGRDGYSLARAASAGAMSAALVITAYLAGAALVPALLPWIPGRAFSLKGAVVGFAVAVLLGAVAWPHVLLYSNWAILAAWLLIMPAVASFLGMNFTGSSTYTSLSGVKKEMRVALPIQGASALAGVALWVAGRFL